MNLLKSLSLKIFLLLLFFTELFPYNSFSQTISGTVNTYTGVNNISSNVLTVVNGSGFSAGDKVMIIQMQGAILDTTNSPKFGNIKNYNGAGSYEFGIIGAVNGNTVTLQNPLCNTFSATGLQMVSVPVYNNVTVTGTLTCSPWDGASGGVLALWVTGTLTLNANIDVSGTGFRGGDTINGVNQLCGDTDWHISFSAKISGEKGESIAAYDASANGGRGKWASGGGGGNPGCSGGGGGGNATAGGLGGLNCSCCIGGGVQQGIGGIALAYNSAKAFLGGGGGGGFGDINQPVTPGTNGGGIILINANTLVGNNDSILSNGLNQTALAADESAGGGGAGGCIILNVQTYTGNLNVEANGGNGGGVFDNIFVKYCYGPGGGGGTGMLLINQPSIPANVNFIAVGGKPGMVLNPASKCYNTTHGATAGTGTAANSVTFNLVLPAPIIPVNIGNDTAFCTLQPVLLNAHSGYTTYKWQDGSTDSTFAVKDTGRFYVRVTNIIGCIASDTVRVSVFPPPDIKLGKNVTGCVFQPVLLHAGPGFASYLWQDGSTDSTFMANDTGTFAVRVLNSIGCYGADTIHISTYPRPVIHLGNDTAVCPGDVITLDAGAGLSNCQWQDGSSSQTYTATQPGKYYVTAQNSFGCSGSDTLNFLPFLPAPPSTPIHDTTICTGTPIILYGPPGFQHYLWNNTFRGSNFQVFVPGTVTLAVAGENGCSSTATATITEYCPPTIYFPNAFSPNGDGNNDIYKPVAYEITDFHIQIFNRWGQLVFESSKVDNGWDGTYNNKPCLTGAYIYMATYTGEADGRTTSGTAKGNITLIR